MKIKIILSKDRIWEFLLGLDVAFAGLLGMIAYTGAPVLLFCVGIILALSSFTDKKFVPISYSKVEKIMIAISFVLFLLLFLIVIINMPQLFTFDCLFIHNCLFS